MERKDVVDGNLAGIISAYFLIYVVWGATYFFIGVALKELFSFQ
ncbi:MAG: hypothetical protein ACLVEJ_21650 [Parabacteroides sp.]